MTVAVVALMIAIIGYVAWRRARDRDRVERSEPAQAIVVGYSQRLMPSDTDDSNERELNYWRLNAVFEFETPDGRTIRAAHPTEYVVGSNRYPLCHTGQSVSIRYDPENPERAFLPLDGNPPRAISESDRPRLHPIGELAQRLTTAVAETPYRIVGLDTRFGSLEVTIELDLANERWWPLYRRFGLTRTFSLRAVANPSTGRITTTVHQSKLHWPTDPISGRPTPRAGAVVAQLNREFGKRRRVEEFGDDPEILHSFTAIEATGWLWRQVRLDGGRR